MTDQLQFDENDARPSLNVPGVAFAGQFVPFST
jgi:hypothetical protein